MKSDSIACKDPFGMHRMAYVEWGQVEARPTVVCVHGLTRNGRDFDKLAAALEKDGRHVICPDIVGRGLSDDLKGHPEGYTHPQSISDVQTLLAAKGIKSVDWVGTSMGGIMGMLLGAAPDTPIRRLVINDVGTIIPLAALQRIAAYVAMPLEFADMAQLERHIRQIYAPFGITREEDWKHILKYGYRTLPSGKLVLAYDLGIAQNFKMLEKDVDLWPAYDAIKAPTLLLHGEVSDVLSAETANEMTSRGPKAKLISYPGVGHAPALMDQNQIEDIRLFLNIYLSHK